jgi:hypothetical protein
MIQGRYPEFPEPQGTSERIEIPIIPDFTDEGIQMHPKVEIKKF